MIHGTALLITDLNVETAGKISIGLQLGGASLETRNLSLGCLRFFHLALLLVLETNIDTVERGEKKSNTERC
jgi:hypothetical protein